jgi:uncharacterized protein YheU (UPF0270 family)
MLSDPLSPSDTLDTPHYQDLLGSEVGEVVIREGEPWSNTKLSLKQLKAEAELSFQRADSVISLKRKRVSKSGSSKRLRYQVSTSQEVEPCFRIAPENEPQSE